MGDPLRERPLHRMGTEVLQCDVMQHEGSLLSLCSDHPLIRPGCHSLGSSNIRMITKHLEWCEKARSHLVAPIASLQLVGAKQHPSMKPARSQHTLFKYRTQAFTDRGKPRCYETNLRFSARLPWLGLGRSTYDFASSRTLCHKSSNAVCQENETHPAHQ